MEPGHPRATMYPLLYQDGEQVEPRYHHACPPPTPTGAADSAPCPPVALGFNKGFSVQLGDLTPATQMSQPWETSAAAPRASGRVSQLLALREAVRSHQRDGLGRGGAGVGQGQKKRPGLLAVGKDVV